MYRNIKLNHSNEILKNKPLPLPKTVIIVCGPTAIGKTAFAIKLAQQFNTEIISADSRQCFSELSIGVARPSLIELKSVPHHFIASHSIETKVDAAIYETFALQELESIFKLNDFAIVVGGTGLYINALCNGLDEMPLVDNSFLKAVVKNYEENGVKWLQAQVEQLDPAFVATGEMKNPQRLMRALSFFNATGKSIISYKSGIKKQRNFNIIKIGLEIERPELIKRINIRVDLMMRYGLLEEVKNLVTFKHLNALQTVGYTELFDYLENKHSLPKAIELIKIHTRQYAKRQMTWFKKDTDIEWLNFE